VGAFQAKPRLVVVLTAMTLANAMILVDQTAVPLALPNIMQTFHVGSSESQWVLNASLLPLAGLLVFGGRLGDLLGRRKVFLLGTVMFAGGSALGGLAPAFAILLAARRPRGRRRPDAPHHCRDPQRRLPGREARLGAGNDGWGRGCGGCARTDDRRRADLGLLVAGGPARQRAARGRGRDPRATPRRG
jgi:hypothetical protein